MGEVQKKPIDWDQVTKLFTYQCYEYEVADFFNMTLDNLDKRCKAELGLSLSEFRRQKKSIGRVKLRKALLDKACSNHPAAVTAAIYLDKKMFPEEQPDYIPPPLPEGSRDVTPSKLKTFEEFAETAGYPQPFGKQIEMMRFGIHETDPRLLLGSRGYGKTDYVVILGTAYQLYCNPSEATILIMTKSTERNGAILGEIRAACEANGMEFERGNQSYLRVPQLKGKDHSVSAVTVKTSTLRGRHPKLIIMDDPVTEDDTSDATRRLVQKKYNELHKLVSNILIIGQPAHKHDLYSKLRGEIKTLEVPHGTIPELDHDLEAQRLAGVDEASISASYHLEVLSEGDTPFDNISYLDQFPSGDSVAFIDPSHKGGDYTALSIVKAYGQGVAVVGYCFKKAWNHALDDMAPLLVKHGVRRLAFETNALGDMPVTMLRQAFKGIGVVGRNTISNKHSRIMAAGSFAHLIHLSKESNKTYTDHVVEYEYNAKYDDAPDSLASCLEWIGLIKGK